MLASATRLRLRSLRFVPPFIVQTLRVIWQLKKAPGNRGISLRKTDGLAFWTNTLWESNEALIAFHRSGAHQSGKPALKTWCDEAVHAHWRCDDLQLLSWESVADALQKYGRLSELDHPSESHAAGRINTQ